jgi:hypothetical protein
MHRTYRCVPLVMAVGMVLLAAPTRASLRCPAMEPPEEDNPPPEICWHTDYRRAMDVAEEQGKMLLIFFYDPHDGGPSERFEAETLGDPRVRRELQDYVCARLPLETRIVVEGEEQTLLKHEAFREMLGRPGVAILDFAHPDDKDYGYVVSTFPLTHKLWYGPKQMQVILDLPPGTLTQRTLIYAVRTHPDKPASTDGQLDANLLKEAESHSQYQARIRLQGHHRWAARFPRINALLPPGLTAREVCAESWPGENLVEAAIECVRCWRLSSGHWSAVRARQRFFGYDMKRGSNGVWYATGIFGGR